MNVYLLINIHSFDKVQVLNKVLKKVVCRVASASAGEVVGRVINIILPFVVLARCGPSEEADIFFLSLAFAFFAYGTVSNAVSAALVPVLVEGSDVRSILNYSWAAVFFSVGVSAAGYVWIRGLEFDIDTLLIFVSVAVMSFSGLIAAPAVAALNLLHRYALAGISWSGRFFPTVFYIFLADDGLGSLAALAIGIAFADALRAAFLLKKSSCRLSFSRAKVQIAFPVAAGFMLASSVIAGLSPLFLRGLAGTGGGGDITIYEVSDRIYSAVVSVATLGMGSVLMVHLARLREAHDSDRQWKLTLKFTMVWAVLSFLGGGLSWAAFPLFQDILGVQGNAAFEKIRSTYLGQILGIPAFVLIVIFARRIVTLGEARMLVPIAALGLAVNGAAGYSLFLNFGVIGLGYAYSMSNYATALAMVWMERRIKFQT